MKLNRETHRLSAHLAPSLAGTRHYIVEQKGCSAVQHSYLLYYVVSRSSQRWRQTCTQSIKSLTRRSEHSTLILKTLYQIMSCMLLIFLKMNNFHEYFFFPQDEKPSDDRKIFVGGLSWETRDAQLKEYFEKFGEVETVNLKLNPQTGRYVFLGIATMLLHNPPIELMQSSPFFSKDFCLVDTQRGPEFLHVKSQCYLQKLPLFNP